MDYGHWIRQERPTESEMLPWHNASYKREVLTQFGDELGVLLEPENRLQERLRAEGHRFFLDPRACILHVGSSTGEIALLSAVGRGREFAIDRRKTWGWPRRMIYALAWPLFPLIRFVQLRQQLLDYRQYSRVADLILPIGLILAAHSVGESLGYLWDLGRSQAYLFKHELLFEYRVKKSEQEELMRLARERISPVAGRVDD